jgi:ubiquitin-conjugating enzyme E2 Q
MEDYEVSSTVLKEVSNGSRTKRPRDHLQPLTDFVPGALDMSKFKMLKQPRYATPEATKQLGKKLQELVKIQNSSKLHELGWFIDSERIENLYQWIIELHSFDKDLPLASDMKKLGICSIVLEMRFTANFPFSPPFVRVVSPRFLPFMAGGGGHVTTGGAICMELLTNNGWLVTQSLESVLLQLRMAISSTEPKPARLENAGGRNGASGSYAVSEAIEAYKRACRTHGWEVPKDIETMQHE